MPYCGGAGIDGERAFETVACAANDYGLRRKESGPFRWIL